MKGKEKCKILKEIRAEIAKANGIEWVTENCTHKGECRGTCPKCESEVRALEREIERRRALGKTVALAGISASLLVSTMGCDELIEYNGNVNGMMAAPEQSTTRTKRTTTTIKPLSGEPDVAILLEQFRCLNESTYVANRALYLEFISDLTYGDDVHAYIAKDEVFTVIGHNTWEGGYLVRRGDGVLLSLYSTTSEDITLLTPAPDFDGEGMTYGGISYLVKDYTVVTEKICRVADPFDIMQLYDRAYTEEKKERLDSGSVITVIGENSKNGSSLIRLEDGSLYVAESYKITAYTTPVDSITLTK